MGALPPHAHQTLVLRGRPLEECEAAMILVHGRGAAPESILELATALAHPGYAYLAPAAAGRTWYPYSFLSRIEDNEPGISSGISVLEGLVERLTAAGVPYERIVLAGFSQGACLTSEFAVRNARRYGGVLAFSGGLIGPPGTEWARGGDFGGTPAFFGCSDVDAHVPEARVRESAEVYRAMGADVELRIYPGMGHLINDDELAYARDLVSGVAGGPPS